MNMKSVVMGLWLGIGLGLLVVGYSGIAGCSDKGVFDSMSKSELVEFSKQAQQQLDEYAVKVQDLENMLQGIQEENAPTAAISDVGDGTGRLTFNSDGGKIKFPEPFMYPESTQAANTSAVQISEFIKISPTANWVMKLNGTELELQHTSGISGKIKVGAINDIYDRNMLQEYMSEALKGLPKYPITYSKLFLEDNWWGLEAKTGTRIDKAEAVLRCGMLGFGEQSFTYVFVYKGKDDADKNETVLSLLQSMIMLGQKLRIE